MGPPGIDKMPRHPFNARPQTDNGFAHSGGGCTPGGIGTLDELCEIMTWRQLGLYHGEVVVVNTNGFFDPLLDMFNRMCRQGFMRGNVTPVSVVSTPDEAIDHIRRHIAHNKS